MRCTHCHGTGREPGTAKQPPSEPPLAGWAPFWAVYPRKTARAAAERAYARLRPSGSLLLTMMSALNEQIAAHDWPRDPKGRFFPHGATWLNGRRWEDQATGPASTSPEAWTGIQVGDHEAERRELEALQPRRLNGHERH